MLHECHHRCGAKPQMNSICLQWHAAVLHASLLIWQHQAASDGLRLLGNSHEAAKQMGDR